jgi:hypothetical protein
VTRAPAEVLLERFYDRASDLIETLLDAYAQARELLCACRACALLFDRGGRYRLVPTRRERLDSASRQTLVAIR